MVKRKKLWAYCVLRIVYRLRNTPYAILLFTAVSLFFFSASLTNAQTNEPAATPTADRLAAPPTVPAPTQADDGAQLYWLYCQPCHGDRGQGLTDAPDDDWRAQYPPEDQFCWNSGCHGARPYENGFTIPRKVPAVLGNDTLTRFATMEEVYTYISTNMPYQWPGALKEEEYLAITAFFAREHGVWQGRQLTKEELADLRLRPLPALSPASDPPFFPWLFAAGAGFLLFLLLGGFFWRQWRR